MCDRLTEKQKQTPPLLVRLMRKPAESVFSTIVDTLWKHPNIRAKYLQTNTLFILFPVWDEDSGPSVLLSTQNLSRMFAAFFNDCLFVGPSLSRMPTSAVRLLDVTQ